MIQLRGKFPYRRREQMSDASRKIRAFHPFWNLLFEISVLEQLGALHHLLPEREADFLSIALDALSFTFGAIIAIIWLLFL